MKGTQREQCMEDPLLSFIWLVSPEFALNSKSSHQRLMPHFLVKQNSKDHIYFHEVT